MVLALRSRCKVSNAPSIRSLVVDEERNEAKPLVCIPFGALKPHLHDTTCCQSRLSNGFDNRLYCVYSRLSNRLSNRFDNQLNEQWLFVQHGYIV